MKAPETANQVVRDRAWPPRGLSAYRGHGRPLSVGATRPFREVFCQRPRLRLALSDAKALQRAAKAVRKARQLLVVDLLAADDPRLKHFDLHRPRRSPAGSRSSSVRQASPRRHVRQRDSSPNRDSGAQPRCDRRCGAATVGSLTPNRR